MLKVRGYMKGSFMNERVPERVQGIVIQEFCKAKGFRHLFNNSEYMIEGSTYIIHDIINKLKEEGGLVLYSLFQMPEDNNERLSLFKRILKKKKKLFFALEDLKLTSTDELTEINNLWLIKKSLNKISNISINDKIFKS